MQDAIHAIEAQGDAVRMLKDDMKTKKKAKVRLVYYPWGSQAALDSVRASH